VAFCAICGRDHEPGAPCLYEVAKTKRKAPSASFDKTKRAADRTMVMLAVGFVGAIALISLVVYLIQRG